jgi:hypothetical protein
MAGLQEWWLRVRLRYLLQKGFRQAIPLGSEESWNNDDVVVRYHPQGQEQGYLLVKVADSYLEVDPVDPSDRERRVRFPFDEARPEYFIVRHFYAVWRVDYTSVTRAFYAVLFHVNFFRVISQRAYDRGLQQHRTRTDVLRALADLWKPELNSRIQIDDVSAQLYGSRIRNSRRGYEYHRRLVFVLQSLAKSGDLELNHADVPSDLKLLPQALQSLADYELQSSRHAASIRISRYQLCVALSMFLVAVATLFTRCSIPEPR